MLTMSRATAAGLLAGYLADLAVGDPRRGHPVALFGRAADALGRRMWADSRARGVAYAGVCVGSAAGVGALAHAATSRSPVARLAVTAGATWAVLGGTGLAGEGAAMARMLESGDVEGARARLPHLCGRDPSGLDEKDLARAATESIAENTSDAVVAPLLWGAVAGLPGLLGYRALNTLDAMVGHRTPRYARFGWASARGDDVANFLPARASALAAAGCAPVVGGRASDAVRVWRRDAAQHPSPNAGPVEAAFAGALDVRLGGVNRYAGAVEDRGTLGDGRTPGVPDLRRAVRLSRAVGAVTAVVAAVSAAVRGESALRRIGGRA
ncbi:cobalamin biosynthesis protein [Haloechinothrix salitolerans]|uniref:Cobalamin biosynthesis protein CobD n=1 Tax=Haloechinothrix salitolerans TaxID=926830 RepID=A0ABW2C0B6_9PSEU